MPRCGLCPTSTSCDLPLRIRCHSDQRETQVSCWLGSAPKCRALPWLVTVPVFGLWQPPKLPTFRRSESCATVCYRACWRRAVVCPRQWGRRSAPAARDSHRTPVLGPRLLGSPSRQTPKRQSGTTSSAVAPADDASWSARSSQGAETPCLLRASHLAPVFEPRQLRPAGSCHRRSGFRRPASVDCRSVWRRRVFRLLPPPRRSAAAAASLHTTSILEPRELRPAAPAAAEATAG